MSECKKTCGNCAGRIKSILSKDRCDMTNKPIEDCYSTCDNWEPNNEVLREMQDDELKSLRQERDELQAQVAVLRGALEEINKVSTEQGLSMLDGACKVDKFACEALETTPSEASDRVQKIVMTLEKIRDAKCISERPGTYYKILASEALSEWRKP